MYNWHFLLLILHTSSFLDEHTRVCEFLTGKFIQLCFCISCCGTKKYIPVESQFLTRRSERRFYQLVGDRTVVKTGLSDPDLESVSSTHDRRVESH